MRTNEIHITGKKEKKMDFVLTVNYTEIVYWM